MHCLVRHIIALSLAVAASGAPALARDASIVILRTDRSIELYLSMPSDMMMAAFRAPETLLASADGTVEVDQFWRGTWNIGDDILNGAEVTLGAADVQFEAMSLMVHPADQRLEMTTPLDGQIAMSVCGAPPPEVAPTLDKLHTYVGYFLDTTVSDAPLALSLPDGEFAGLDVTVWDYTGYRLTNVTRTRLSEGGTLVAESGGFPQRVLAWARAVFWG
ncbi:MAG: hypothetical protein AAF667_16910 [Pseudomonadota bacterium]